MGDVLAVLVVVVAVVESVGKVVDDDELGEERAEGPEEAGRSHMGR